MTIYHLFLNNFKVQATCNDVSDENQYIGSVDIAQLHPEDLEELLGFCQNATDCVLTALSSKANQIGNNRKKEMN